MEISAEISAALARTGDQVIGDTVAALDQRDQAQRRAAGAAERRRDVEHLFKLVRRCLHEGRPDSIVMPSQQIAADRFVAGIDLGDVQAAFVVLEEVLWRHLSAELAGDEQLTTLRLVTAILGTGRDALARSYVALAKAGIGTRARDRLTGGAAGGAGAEVGAAERAKLTGTDGPVDAVVQTEVQGPVGIITLDDRHKRNAIGARLADSIVAALASLREQNVRIIVIRAAPGMSVWSAGHDISELPQGRRDPLGYDDPLEGLLRAIRTFPAPVLAMVHGTVWGGALDLVLSCDLVTADETASFAITPANLGLPYNTAGLLHFVGRLPINLIKELFFTAAPLDAQKAKECMVVNHLVAADELEAVTMELAGTMAKKSPMAMAVIKEQLRVLTDYQPIAAEVYERLQGLRRRAYDSSDYLEGLRAFAEKRPPVFRGN
jgi:methylmalonyl-CoA decarboxylase